MSTEYELHFDHVNNHSAKLSFLPRRHSAGHVAICKRGTRGLFVRNIVILYVRSFEIWPYVRDLSIGSAVLLSLR